MSVKKRNELEPLIRAWALDSQIAEASVEEIAEFNILGALHRGMERAVSALLERHPSWREQVKVLIDGNSAPKLLKVQLGSRLVTQVKGDQKCLSVAAASIIAKTFRDRKMIEYASRFPEFRFERNAGYGTRDHQRALEECGVTPLHRRGFEPVDVELRRGNLYPMTLH